MHESARPDWRHRALCRDADPEIFFPPGDGPTDAAQTAAAVAICYACPVRAACLKWAIDTREAHGVWGGLTPDERREMRRSELAGARRARARARQVTAMRRIDELSEIIAAHYAATS